MTTKTFDPTKPVQTRDGRKARIICTDRDHIDGKIVALIKDHTSVGHEGEEKIIPLYENGRYIRGNTQHPADLVNVPERVVRYVNVPAPGKSFETLLKKTSVISGSYTDFIPVGPWSTVKLTFEDGKLVDSEVVR